MQFLNDSIFNTFKQEAEKELPFNWMYSNTPRVTQILPHYDFTSLRLYVIHFNELHASINKIYVVGDPVYDHG